MTLLIAMPGPQLPENGHAPGTVPPALPALSSLLGAARRLGAAADWRAGILQALQGGSGLEMTQVAVVARSLPDLPAATALCMATPLHVVPGMSRVHLPANGILALDDAEREAWRSAFNHEFGSTQLLLHAVPGGWVLQGACAAAARDADPDTLLGQPLARNAAADEPERDLRRLGAEVEMWLAAQPLNAAREARRVPPLNCLWFWGAGSLALPKFASPPGVVLAPGGTDPWVAGLARHCEVPCVTAGVDWPLAQRHADALVIAATAAALDARQQWQALEARWFQPAWQAWRAGEISALRLQIGRSTWQLPYRSPLRWLRRQRPWWQLVQS